MSKANVGLVAHPASVDSRLCHRKDFLGIEGYNLRALFGPQHGFTGYTQANMIEVDSESSKAVPVYSLYGDVRQPTQQMLKGLDAVIVDLQDVGVRGYTYVWTMLLVMQACAENGVKVVVTDRPNPIGGEVVEGPLLDQQLFSFVGMHPIPIRHGMTIGELAMMFKDELNLSVDLTVEPSAEGWQRSQFFDQTPRPWVMPSPNLPTLESTLVYPGMELFEGTNLSEGRGSTRPFELFGAPFIEAERLTQVLNEKKLAGVHFRAVTFKPTFDKWQGEVCGGAQIHVIDRKAWRSVEAALQILSTIKAIYPDKLEFLKPPYEYETVNMPFDILVGNTKVRTSIENGEAAAAIVGGWQPVLGQFLQRRQPYLSY
jgi:uncharacterized protein YbbC (DUF1343 family)